jgi:hypothetical protein
MMLPDHMLISIVLRKYQGPPEKKLRLDDVVKLFLQMRDVA